MPDRLLRALESRTRAAQRVALVVAHPDDETIAAGGSLHLLPGLLLVHVTDGAPRRLDDAGRLGFPSSAAYAAAREAELAEALRLSGADPVRACLGVPDQDAACHMPAIAAELHALLARHGIETVLTHAYEGGHPDHDATSCCVHHVARRLGLPVLEFAGYHAGPHGGTVVQRFLPGPPGAQVELPPDDEARKRAMLACFRTQADTLAPFQAGTERFRPASEPDVRRPPHAGPLNYENWGWEMTGSAWRNFAAAFLTAPACAR